MTRCFFAFALLLSSLVPAGARSNPLVGLWLTTYTDPRGVTNSALYVRFTSDGRLLMHAGVGGTGGSGELTTSATYSLTGSSSYKGTVVDYEPKSIPPLLGGPPGTKFHCTFKLENSNVLEIACGSSPATRYTRQG